ncbi:hypothetical protein CTAYLR_008185 [Chrysophaeum taylorii]|uniref:F-actin-capping protein subunit alpha n=1 Tax=Chrysophaeum taylorii TaxID=2483200 RepID=A0AAD7U9M2_9STRA|nr:hypothetical protein CTAYLR_008185 [Chrysophaeum taylorii]
MAAMEEDQRASEDAVSDEDKAAIIQHLMLNSPPGQLRDVKADALALVPAGVVSQPMLAGICRAYNTANLQLIPQKNLVLCEEAEIDPTHYLDPSTGDVYAVDHVSLSAEKTETRVPTAPEVEAERSVVEAALGKYVRSRYSSANARAAVFATDQGDLKIALSAENLNLRNYWSGNWRSTWTVSLAGAQASVQGTLKLRAHYFEDGNVQLQTTKDVEPSPVSAADLGRAVTDVIEDAETSLQQGLEDMYNNMTHETFKAMRRIMPITRTKMKWNVYEVALNRNLRK